jgi:hypothetical protein
VLGDLLTTIESSKRATWNAEEGCWNLKNAQTITLPYSKRTFFVPDNVYVLATMNTTDRSVAPLDAALRRRFAFKRLWPVGFEPDGATNALKDRLAARFARTWTTYAALNTHLLERYGPDAMLGHSYLHDLVATPQHTAPGHTDATVEQDIWNERIGPQVADILVTHHAKAGDPWTTMPNLAINIAGSPLAPHVSVTWKPTDQAANTTPDEPNAPNPGTEAT